MKEILKAHRLRLILAKLQVKHVARSPTGYIFSIDFPGMGTMHCQVPTHADVREGDLLTIYTEVLSKAPIEGPTDANAGRPSIQ